ncbi:unnamed protein product [Nippostrongylus brasiliensis]|uniref:C2H2-type domain-containing protein n=1 Tax=Nippostrongylus brasiliensis TaxID=27835 RepID=A0A0N4Y956_NIPBR|nr:unnamed protein product [Nippostrongylus brasiliensis]
MSSGVSSGQATCEVCEKVMLCRNVSSHLKKMHNYTTEQAEEVKKTLKMETMIEGLIICPIYDDQFLNKEGFAGHCLMNHSDDGADATSEGAVPVTGVEESQEVLNVLDVETHIPAADIEPIVPAQERLGLRKMIRNKTEMAYATVMENVNVQVKEDSDEAMQKLTMIFDQMEVISRIKTSARSGELQMVPRTERAQLRKKRRAEMKAALEQQDPEMLGPPGL